MQRFTIIHPLFMSFFSRSLYQDVARNWKGLCFAYLLSLLALTLLPEVLKVRKDLSDFLRNEAPRIIRQVPPITISKGKVSVEGQEPYFILDEKTGNPLIIIDTTGRINTLGDSSALILVRKTDVLIKKDKTETRTLDLADIEDFSINRNLLYGWMEGIEDSFAFLVYPFAVVFSFLYHIVKALLFAAMGLLLARAFRSSIDYRALVRLSVISMTPALVLNTFLITVGLVVPNWWAIGFLLTTGYLFFAVRVNSEKGPEELS